MNLTTTWKRQTLSQRVLRFFLGCTWIYAGWDKASDPGFLSQGAPTFIGTQLAAYAQNSPISGLLQHTIEHATQVGVCASSKKGKNYFGGNTNGASPNVSSACTGTCAAKDATVNGC